MADDGSSWTHYLGPVGAAYDYIKNGKLSGNATSYLDPGDLTGKQASSDVLQAGKEAQAQLMALSQQAWDRQMQGLQRALGSMNNYNGVLSNLYGVPTNYYDPSQSGGVMGTRPGEGGGAQPPTPTPGHPTAVGGLGGLYPSFQPNAPVGGIGGTYPAFQNGTGGLGGVYPSFQPNGVDSNIRPGFVKQ